MKRKRTPYAPFYDQIIHEVIVPAILAVLRDTHISSKTQLWKVFKKTYECTVSYMLFSEWLKDAGITMQRSVTFGMKAPELPPDNHVSETVAMMKAAEAQHENSK